MICEFSLTVSHISCQKKLSLLSVKTTIHQSVLTQTLSICLSELPLLDRTRQRVPPPRELEGISGTAFKCFSSYLSGGSFSVNVCIFQLTPESVSCYLLTTFKGVSYHCHSDVINLDVFSFFNLAKFKRHLSL